jgi:drug/metabolite transporter (DMT)-like permease
VPPFQLAALTFAIGGSIGLMQVAHGRAWVAFYQPIRVWVLGIGGLFGYHALYFTALRLAPPAEAGLLNYFWPLLIVLFSSFLPGERLHMRPVVGALFGLLATIVLFMARGFAPALDHASGYAAAFCAAFVWAAYSVLSRRFANVPTATVAGFCLGTAALATLCHVLFESTVWPHNLKEWLSILALGFGPVGIAFYAWDIGVKHGDIRLLGVASYLAPILSTAFLVLGNFAEASISLGVAALLIAGGGWIAATDSLRKK